MYPLLDNWWNFIAAKHVFVFTPFRQIAFRHTMTTTASCSLYGHTLQSCEQRRNTAMQKNSPVYCEEPDIRKGRVSGPWAASVGGLQVCWQAGELLGPRSAASTAGCPGVGARNGPVNGLYKSRPAATTHPHNKVSNVSANRQNVKSKKEISGKTKLSVTPVGNKLIAI